MRTLALVAALLAVPAAAGAPALHISGWARPTVPAQTSAAAYLTIHNMGQKTDRLLSISTPAAASASVHATTIAGGVARMRAAGPQTIAPGAMLAMKPGGLHLMLMGLKSPLKAGQRLPLTLRFQHAGVLQTSVPIQMGADDGGHQHH